MIHEDRLTLDRDADPALEFSGGDARHSDGSGKTGEGGIAGVYKAEWHGHLHRRSLLCVS